MHRRIHSPLQKCTRTCTPRCSPTQASEATASRSPRSPANDLMVNNSMVKYMRVKARHPIHPIHRRVPPAPTGWPNERFSDLRFALTDPPKTSFYNFKNLNLGVEIDFWEKVRIASPIQASAGAPSRSPRSPATLHPIWYEICFSSKTLWRWSLLHDTINITCDHAV